VDHPGCLASGSANGTSVAVPFRPPISATGADSGSRESLTRHTGQVRLGDGGAAVELRVVGYQFPDLEAGTEPRDPDSSDSNWLVIDGSVRTAAGTSWSFQNPALTTWEVAELAAWLENVAAGAVHPATTPQEAEETVRTGDVPDDDQLRAAGWLTFLEPNLSFAVGSRAGEQVKLLVAFSHEAAGATIDVGRPRRSQITVVTTTQHVHDAAGALHEQLVTYPAR